MTTTFDTLTASRSLEAAGMDARQAEAVVIAISQSKEAVATKTDLEALRAATKTDLEALQAATKADLETLRVATKADLEALRVATKADLAVLENRMTKHVTTVAGILLAAMLGQAAITIAAITFIFR